MKSLQTLFLRYIIFSFFALCFFTVEAQYPAGTAVNFVRTWDATAPQADGNALTASLTRDARMTTQYLDGLGRPLQTVVKEGSLETSTGLAADIVAPVIYDNLGREAAKYLPFVANTTGGYSTNDGSFKMNPFQQQPVFMAAQYGSQGETYFYSQTNFEPSPLNRVDKAMAAGNSWVGSNRGAQLNYWFNTAIDAVRIWRVTDNTGTWGSYASPGIYPAGELVKTVTTDEKGVQVIEFKDKEGNVILKKVQVDDKTSGIADDGTGRNNTGWLCTYYIYDDFNQLRCVIQPKGIELIAPSFSLTDPVILAEQCFRYEYDGRKRMIWKKVPGAGEVYMIYDARDRLVMMQDANMRPLNNWMVTKYDLLNRPVESGLWTDANTFSTHTTNATGSINYPVTSSGYEQLSVSHYDDYVGLPSGLSSTFNTAYNTNFATTNNAVWPYPQMPTRSLETVGITTWSQTKILGSSPAKFISTVMLYDDKGRVVQVQSINQTGGLDITTTQYSWAGQALVMVQRQQKSGPINPQDHIVVSKMDYDNLGRLLTTRKSISSTINAVAVAKAEQKISSYQYDKLGQLKIKKLSPDFNSGSALESLTYDYNIRGWMLGMNRDYAKDLTTNNYFGFDLGYDKANNNIIGNQSYTNPQYNGNIEGTVWKSKGDAQKRRYDFSYDGANRLMAADFNQYDGSAFNKSALVDFSMKMGDGTDYLTAYDANGNIKQMQQSGLAVNTSIPIDNLKYNYLPNSNRLKSVADFLNVATSKLGDFKTSANHPQSATKTALTATSSQAQFDAITDYTYDLNGSLNADNNKDISSITYNHLNLPKVITVANKGTITYTYDASGGKLQKQTIDIGTVNKTITTTTTYLGGFVYESKTTAPADVDHPDYTDVLQFLAQDEGRARFIPVVGTTPASFAYDYFLKDHLGNTRSVITE